MYSVRLSKVTFYLKIHKSVCTFIRKDRVPVHYWYSLTLRIGTYFACKYVTH